MGGLYGIDLIYIYIYIFTFTFTFSNLADAFIQSDLQMRTMEIYMYYVCVFFFFFFANMIYSNAIFSSVFYQL